MYCHLLLFGSASTRSYKIDVIGNNWLVGRLVGNPVFSETALRVFLTFCKRLGGDYKGRKVTVLDFSKKNLIRGIREKVSKLAQNQTLIFFSKTALTIFLVFGLKLVLSMTFNLNETYSSEKFAISRYLASKSSQRKPKLTFFAIFSTLHY